MQETEMGWTVFGTDTKMRARNQGSKYENVWIGACLQEDNVAVVLGFRCPSIHTS